MISFKSFYEDLTFKVEVEGLPAMYMSGNSPGQVKNHLRKLVKQPSMIKSVKRQTKHDVKKMYRDKAQGKGTELDEDFSHMKNHANSIASDHRAAAKAHMAANKKATAQRSHVLAVQHSRAADHHNMAADALKSGDYRKAMRHSGNAVNHARRAASTSFDGAASKAAKNIVKTSNSAYSKHVDAHNMKESTVKNAQTNEDSFGRRRLPLGKRNPDHPLKKQAKDALKSIPPSKPLKDLVKGEMTQQSKTHPNLKIAVGKSAQLAKDSQARAAKRKKDKSGTPLAAGTQCEATSGEVDYGTDQSVKILKKITPNEDRMDRTISRHANAMKIHKAQFKKTGDAKHMNAFRDAKKRHDTAVQKQSHGQMENYIVKQYKDGKTTGVVKRFKGLKKATAHANKQGGDHRVHKEDVNEKITLAKVRKALYKGAKALGDVQAVRKKRVGKRIVRRAAGKVAGRALGKLFR